MAHKKFGEMKLNTKSAYHIINNNKKYKSIFVKGIKCKLNNAISVGSFNSYIFYFNKYKLISIAFLRC